MVNVIVPAYVETDMNTTARSDENLGARVLAQIPSGRMARDEELGSIVICVASPASGFMTGETLVFDGGQSAK